MEAPIRTSQPPVISLEGPASVSLEAGTVYTDAGATATDNIDGSITRSILTDNPVDIDTVGTYTITYNVSDAAGNAATAVTRTVVVSDTTLPVINSLGAASVSLEAGTGYTDAGATATDNIDGSITSSILTDNPVDIDTVGTYTVTYNVSDAAGNAATAVTRTVVIVEPVLTGYFTDSAVEGLTYKTDTQSGVTDLNGAFTYQAGETIAFSIGDFMLGESATAAPEMTPLDLIPDAFLPTTRNELLPLLRNKTINTAEVIAFRKLSNMLTFLQALDYDKDASNGITIVDGMGIVLESVSIDFAAELTEFKDALPLRQVMSAAVTQNLISSGFIKELGQALNHFYQAQEISHSFKAIANFSGDTNGDGDADLFQTVTYDDNGNELTVTTDTDGNGDTNELTTSTYDTNGNQLTRSYDSNGDGDANEITTYTYDTYGNPLTYSQDTDADGELDEITTYTYDTDGNELTKSYENDGELNQIIIYTYDTDGNLLTRGYDGYGDGELNRIVIYTYDDNGNRLTRSYDTDANGEPNEITTYTYDTDGNELTVSFDNDADGNANSISTYTYDTDGNELTKSNDTDGDSKSISTYTYNADGNQLTYSADFDADGELNRITTYTYDTDGNPLTLYIDTDGNGISDQNATLTYDDDSNLLTISLDVDANGTADLFQTVTYVGGSIAQSMAQETIIVP